MEPIYITRVNEQCKGYGDILYGTESIYSRREWIHVHKSRLWENMECDIYGYTERVGRGEYEYVWTNYRSGGDRRTDSNRD